VKPSPKAKRTLLDKGALPDEVLPGAPPEKTPAWRLTKPELRALAWGVVALAAERFHSHDRHDAETVVVAKSFVRAADKVAERSEVLAGAMIVRLQLRGPAWVVGAVMGQATPAFVAACKVAGQDLKKADRVATSE
jgi:hypothetical protein